MGSHPSKDELERYSLGRVTPVDRAHVEEHLLICESCRSRLTELDAFTAAMRSASQVAATFRANRPIDVVHYTEEGPVSSRSKKEKQGRWLAVHEGVNLEGGRICRTLREANEYLFRSFVEMFPEHRCTAECGRVTHGEHPPIGRGAAGK
jgi:hypothetical protein